MSPLRLESRTSSPPRYILTSWPINTSIATSGSSPAQAAGRVLGVMTALLVLLTACSGRTATGGASGTAPSANQASGQATSPLTYTAADRQQKLGAAAQQEAALVWYTSLTIGIAQTLAQTCGITVFGSVERDERHSSLLSVSRPRRYLMS